MQIRIAVDDPSGPVLYLDVRDDGVGAAAVATQAQRFPQNQFVNPAELGYAQAPYGPPTAPMSA